MNLPLKRGSQGPDVRALQSLLQSQGFYPYEIDGEFGSRTYAGVVHFQQTHHDGDQQPLAVDGEVGPITYWALLHPSGDLQRRFLATSNPNVQSEPRAKIIAWMESEHAKGIHETPDGSNDSPRIRQYLASVGLDFPAPWCAATRVCAETEVFGSPKILRSGLVAAIWNDGLKRKIAHSVGNYSPIPADVAIMLHGDGTGHLTTVYRVGDDGQSLNCHEGNCGNRLALTHRRAAEFVGFINPFGDEDHRPAFDVGTIASDAAGGDR